jgi:uncharacterized protein
MSGTWINVLTVLVGTGAGLILRHHLRANAVSIMTQAVGLITLVVGFRMAGSLPTVQIKQVDGVILGLMIAIAGGLMGEWWQLETRLQQVGDWLKRQVRSEGQFTEGFVSASLLFCVGPMTILGCLNNGLTGDSQLLLLKSALDGFAAIALSSSLGVGVGFSALVILVYQGGLSLGAGLLAQAIPDPAHNPGILLLTGVGGLMIMGIGLNLLDVARIRVASFLPALILAPIFWAIANQLFN